MLLSLYNRDRSSNFIVMKMLIKFAASVLLMIAVSVSSCRKDPVPPIRIINPPSPPPLPLPPLPRSPLPPLPAVYDSLSGREFLFKDLVWKSNTWHVYVEVPNSNLFLNRGIEVSIDSSVRIDVPFYTFEFLRGTFPFPENNGYVYDNSWFASLFVFAIDYGSEIAGTRVSIKVKVL